MKMWTRFQVNAFPGRQGFCVRECSTPPGYAVAAAVTRGHPATESPAPTKPCGAVSPEAEPKSEEAMNPVTGERCDLPRALKDRGYRQTGKSVTSCWNSSRS